MQYICSQERPILKARNETGEPEKRKSPGPGRKMRAMELPENQQSDIMIAKQEKNKLIYMEKIFEKGEMTYVWYASL